MVHSAFLPSLSALAELAESGTAARNFSARTCDLPLSLEIKDFNSGLEAKVGDWKVVARVPPRDLDIIITQLRKLGIEAVGVYSSPATGLRESAEYAWICSSNFDDVTLMTAAPPKTAALVHTVILELAMPAPGVSLAPANSSPRKPVETVSN